MTKDFDASPRAEARPSRQGRRPGAIAERWRSLFKIEPSAAQRQRLEEEAAAELGLDHRQHLAG